MLTSLTTAASAHHERLRGEIHDWIVNAALAGNDDTAILDGVCARLDAAGLPLTRVAVSSQLLDPTLDARGVLWKRETGATEELYPRESDPQANEDWERSPFFRLLESKEATIRRRLDASYQRGEFPLLDTLQTKGATDYVALAIKIDESARFGDSEGVISSWTTDAQNGYSDGDLAMIAAVMPAIALAFTLRTVHRTARTLIATYLGDDAALRVLGGNIVRGRAEPIRAVIWNSDLVGFTRISGTHDPEAVLAMLNDYAEAQVEAIESNGGTVLKFVGDGILAIFPDADPERACAQALDAARAQCNSIDALKLRRADAGLPITDVHLALHIGELLYGNVGSPRRLDFTVLGPAVNEVARIEALCGSLEQAVIVSSAFAEAAGAARGRLVSLGRYAMKGVARPQEMFTLDPEIHSPG